MNYYEALFNYWWSTNILLMCSVNDYMKQCTLQAKEKK